MYLLRVFVDVDRKPAEVEILDASRRVGLPHRIEYQVVPSGASL